MSFAHDNLPIGALVVAFHAAVGAILKIAAAHLARAVFNIVAAHLGRALRTSAGHSALIGIAAKLRSVTTDLARRAYDVSARDLRDGHTAARSHRSAGARAASAASHAAAA